ncbi:MAG: hypothetical protein L0I76_37740, partial [Pseudonocardia sp.]|nr:hypothetical protein [Pseudonocardia sp.]
AEEIADDGSGAWEVLGKATPAYSNTSRASASSGSTGAVDYDGRALAVGVIDSQSDVTASFSGYSTVNTPVWPVDADGGNAGCWVGAANVGEGDSTSTTFTVSGNDQLTCAVAVFGRAEVAVVAPTVDAGSDATVTVGDTFTRTASETGDPATSRAWTVVSGPAEVDDTLATAAALSWAPGTPGVYVLRYTASNAGGSDSDDVTVTAAAVVVVGPTLVAHYEVDTPASGGTSLESESFTPAEGEILVVKSLAGDSGATLGAPSGGGLTYTLRASSSTAGWSTGRIDTAVVGASPSAMTVSVSVTNGTNRSPSLYVERWAGVALADPVATNAVKTGTTAQTMNPVLTSTVAGSVITWCVGDWQVVSGGTPAYWSAGAVQIHEQRNSATNYWSVWQPDDEVGGQVLGMSAPTGQKWTLLGIELVPAAAAEPRRNASTCPYAAGVGPGWGGNLTSGTTITAVDVPAFLRGRAMRGTRTTTGGCSVITPYVSVVPGEVWSRTVEVAGAAGIAATVWFNFRKASGGFLSPNPSQSVTLSPTPQTVTFEGVTAPALATTLDVSVEATISSLQRIEMSTDDPEEAALI